MNIKKIIITIMAVYISNLFCQVVDSRTSDKVFGNSEHDDNFCEYKPFEIPPGSFPDYNHDFSSIHALTKKVGGIGDSVTVIGKTIGTIEDDILNDVTIDFTEHGKVVSNVTGIFTIRLPKEEVISYEATKTGYMTRVSNFWIPSIYQNDTLLIDLIDLDHSDFNIRSYKRIFYDAQGVYPYSSMRLYFRNAVIFINTNHDDNGVKFTDQEIIDIEKWAKQIIPLMTNGYINIVDTVIDTVLPEKYLNMLGESEQDTCVIAYRLNTNISGGYCCNSCGDSRYHFSCRETVYEYIDEHIVKHETIHALGLGHTSGIPSVMTASGTCASGIWYDEDERIYSQIETEFDKIAGKILYSRPRGSRSALPIDEPIEYVAGPLPILVYPQNDSTLKKLNNVDAYNNTINFIYTGDYILRSQVEIDTDSTFSNPTIAWSFWNPDIFIDTLVTPNIFPRKEPYYIRANYKTQDVYKDSTIEILLNEWTKPSKFYLENIEEVIDTSIYFPPKIISPSKDTLLALTPLVVKWEDGFSNTEHIYITSSPSIEAFAENISNNEYRIELDSVFIRYFYNDVIKFKMQSVDTTSLQKSKFDSVYFYIGVPSLIHPNMNNVNGDKEHIYFLWVGSQKLSLNGFYYQDKRYFDLQISKNMQFNDSLNYEIGDYVGWGGNNSIDDAGVRVKLYDKKLDEKYYWRYRIKDPADPSKVGFWAYDSFIITENLLDIKESSMPLEFFLEQNYPNPFNPLTTIKYSLPSESNIEFSVYNIAGQLVHFKNFGKKSIGYHQIQYNGEELSTGIYFYQMKIGDKLSKPMKMTILK